MHGGVKTCTMTTKPFVDWQIMSGDPGEDPQIHACKLLEVLVLQCQGRIDSVSLLCGRGTSGHVCACVGGGGGGTRARGVPHVHNKH